MSRATRIPQYLFFKQLNAMARKMVMNGVSENKVYHTPRFAMLAVNCNPDILPTNEISNNGKNT